MSNYPTSCTKRARVVILLSVLLLGVGCGKKAPPIAPRQPEMTAVLDLIARYEDNTVFLSWHHPPSSAAVTGYLVYKSGQVEDGSACKGCPILFEKVDTQPLDPKMRNTRHKLTWSQTVDSGFQYTFKVAPTQSSGARGPDSNFAVVNALE